MAAMAGDLRPMKIGDELLQYLKTTYSNACELDTVLHHLSLPPLFTTLRINDLEATKESIVEQLQEILTKQYESKGLHPVEIKQHPRLSDTLYIAHRGPRLELPQSSAVRKKRIGGKTDIHLHWNGIRLRIDLSKEFPDEITLEGNLNIDLNVTNLLDTFNVAKEHRMSAIYQLETKVVVGIGCAMAVLRGAHVFAQGVVGAPSYLEAGKTVSVYADVDGGCRKGLVKPYEGPTIFLGNGRMVMSRRDLFVSTEKVAGMAIEMVSPLYEAPSLSGILPNLVFPQNLPSALCSHVLNPQPGQSIIDMCAAPGGKTIHLATLMKNKGRVVALDKTAGKITKVENNAREWNITCIETYAFDASRSCSATSDVTGPPPYPPETFDNVLLDAPCSALGQRPSAANSMRLREVSSYPVLQRKIFTEAVALLKEGGCLVYSTCSITVEENEQQVAWALAKFPQLDLIPQEPHLGGTGRPCPGLDEEQRRMLQTFDPLHISDDVDQDSIGFFIAKFTKKSIK